jgi:hypothetical protein
MASKVRGAVVVGVLLLVAVVLVALAFIIVVADLLILGSFSSCTEVGRPEGAPVLLGENAVMTVPQGIIIHNTNPIKLC